jgi:hypothetical protein
VVTFSINQADAILDAVDKAREDRPDLNRFFDDNDRLSAFFVKSLESVQGDERDVIIFSIGYGPDEAGKITTNFGVLNKAKGWRRLNVAITRARERIEVVSSVRAANLPPSPNENVEYLRAFLDYAERGQSALAIDLGISGRDAESPFEESVIKSIQSWGYTTEPQVGAAAFRIDIGVRDPDYPGTFALGVECDGYQYHSAPAARDRDRLREEVLRGLGWRLHRIWGTAWYRNRLDEEVRLRKAIEEAVNASAIGRPTAPPRASNEVYVEAPRDERAERPTWISEYQAAPIEPLPRWVNPTKPGTHHDMVGAIHTLASVEGPVHIAQIHQRLKKAWDIGHITLDIRDNIDKAVEACENINREDGFIDIRSRQIDRVREPAAGIAREPEEVEQGELSLALVWLLRDRGEMPQAELFQAAASIFGWISTDHRVGNRLQTAFRSLVAKGEVTELGDCARLTVPD